MSKPSVKRVIFLDELRGLSVILMVIYHLFFNLTEFYGYNISIFRSNLVEFLLDFFIIIFICVSGIVCTYSRNPRKRGLLYFGIGMIFTLVTYIFTRETTIKFGIMHFFGLSMIIFSFIKESFFKKTKKFMPIILIILFVFSYSVREGYIGFMEKFLFLLPESFYQTKFLFFLGFPYFGFSSGDYFPMIPYFFLFFFANYIGFYLKKETAPEFFYKSHSPFLEKVGRNTLQIYVLHQPILILLLYIIHLFI